MIQLIGLCWRFSHLSPWSLHNPTTSLPPNPVASKKLHSGARWFSGCAPLLERRELPNSSNVLFGGISYLATLSQRRVLLRTWMLFFVLIGVKWVELSKSEESHYIWLPGKNLISVGTIFCLQCSSNTQHLVKSGRLCHWLNRPGFPSVYIQQTINIS